MFTIEQELLLSLDVTYSSYMQRYGWKVCRIDSPIGLADQYYYEDIYRGFTLQEALNDKQTLDEHNHNYKLSEILND